MSPSVTALLRTLLRELVYLELTESIGKRVELDSYESLAPILRQAIPALEDCELIGPDREKFALSNLLLAEALRETELPSDYLPRRFVIEDACVTNSAYVWLSKHLYL